MKNAPSRQGLPTCGSLQALEQIVPLAPQRFPQTHDDFYGRTLPPRLHVLVVTFCNFRARGELVLGETEGEADSLEISIHIIKLFLLFYVKQRVAGCIKNQKCRLSTRSQLQRPLSRKARFPHPQSADFNPKPVFSAFRDFRLPSRSLCSMVRRDP